MNVNSVFAALALALLQGCALVKIGGTKSMETQEQSRKLQEVHLESLASIEPRLQPSGELTLWVTGRFREQYDVRETVTEYGNEWMAIGFFPGYDSHVSGHWRTDGERDNPAWTVAKVFGWTVASCGLCTVASLLEVADPRTAQPNKGLIGASEGLFGTYKYEGDRYASNVYRQDYSDSKRSVATRQLKGFSVSVDGTALWDHDGVVYLDRTFATGEGVTFRLTVLPRTPQADKDVLSPFVNRSFKAMCR